MLEQADEPSDRWTMDGGAITVGAPLDEMRAVLDRARGTLMQCGVELLSEDHDVSSLHRSLANLRARFLSAEAPTDIRLVRGGTFWDLTPKYRFDVLAFEIPRIVNRFAWAIGLASVELPTVASGTATYFPGNSDLLFWYHIDAGLRLASSGWDRLALLLDLAYELQLNSSCNFRRALSALGKKHPPIELEETFKTMQILRDGSFNELESGKGKGRRHEATHVLSPGTRFFCEFLDTYGKDTEPLDVRCRRERDLLVEQHRSLIVGSRAAIRLAAMS